MQPIFRLYADSQEITAAIRDRLIEMMVTDEAGIQSDELKLTLDDRRREDGAIAQLPRIGTVLTVSMGYAETRLVSMGRFIVDEVEMRSPPATLTVSAKAADMVGPFRSPKTRSWDATTLGQLVEAIAAEHRYEAKVDPELGAIAIPHLDQTEESDMALLTRLAAKHDAVAKPVAGFLVLAKQGAIKTITGQVMPTISLNASDLAEWRYRHSARKPGGSGSTSEGDTQKTPTTASGGTRAYWWDFEKGERREVTTGQPPFEEIRYVHATEAEAQPPQPPARTLANGDKVNSRSAYRAIQGSPPKAGCRFPCARASPPSGALSASSTVLAARATPHRSSASASPRRPFPSRLPNKETPMPEKDPSTYGLITYLWVTGLAAWGGLVNFYRKVKSGETRAFNVVELIGEIATSAFAGLITFWLCEAAQFNPLVTAALVGISGHMGSQAIYQLERWAQTRLGKERP